MELATINESDLRQVETLMKQLALIHKDTYDGI